MIKLILLYQLNEQKISISKTIYIIKSDAKAMSFYSIWIKLKPNSKWI